MVENLGGKHWWKTLVEKVQFWMCPMLRSCNFRVSDLLPPPDVALETKACNCLITSHYVRSPLITPYHRCICPTCPIGPMYTLGLIGQSWYHRSSFVLLVPLTTHIGTYTTCYIVSLTMHIGTYITYHIPLHVCRAPHMHGVHATMHGCIERVINR